jgi:preprotein translocase subunit SecG
MYSVFIMLQIVSSVALIAIVMSQATKSEGLSGTIGGKSESAFQGKPGFEDRLSEITKWAAVFFMVTSAIVSFLPPK